MNVPRLLPLIGIAVVGVVAINALAGARDLPQLLSAARAMAEGAPPTDKTAKTTKAAKQTDPIKQADAAKPPAPPLPPLGATPAAGRPAAGICAPDAAEFAKSAGLSPAESQLLASLQNRRGQIDQREKDLDVQVQLLTAAEVKLDAKLKSMADLKAQIEALMGQADQKTQGEVDRLVTVYSKMKDTNAAAVMSQLDDKVRVPVAAGMKPQILAAVLAKMNPVDAKKLTELLARRFAPVQQLADAARAAPTAQPPAQPPAKADAKPDAKAKADAASADDANVDANTDAAKPVKKAKPVRVARRAPKKKPVSKAKPAVEQAKATAADKPAASPAKDAQPKPADPSPTAAPAKAS